MKRVILVVCFGIDFARVALFVVRATVNASVCRLPMVPVVVAAKDIPAGVRIDLTAVYVVQWPVGTQPARGYASVDAVVGRVSDRDIYSGEPLVPVRLTAEQPSDRLDVKVTGSGRGHAGIREPNDS